MPIAKDLKFQYSNLRGNIAKNASDPVDDQDLATKSYTDTKTTLLSVYPIGSIYISVFNTNPSSLFGGSWVAFGAGKVLVGQNGGDADFDTAEETGGAKAVTIAQANLPNISTGNNSAAHTHEVAYSVGSKAFAVPSGSNHDVLFDYDQVGGFNASSGNNSATHTHSLGGSGTALPSMNPYIVCYFWKRTV